MDDLKSIFSKFNVWTSLGAVLLTTTFPVYGLYFLVSICLNVLLKTEHFN